MQGRTIGVVHPGAMGASVYARLAAIADDGHEGEPPDLEAVLAALRGA